MEELTTLIDTAEDESVIDENESELVKAAIDFPDISASEAMTARVDVIAIDIDDSWEEILSVIERSRYTRIPVYEGSIDHVIGTLHLNRFLKALTENKHPDLRSLLMEPCYVYKTMKLPQVLKTLRKKRQHLAIVVDEYGGTLGIISMEDVLEMVVGDIWDENDTVQNYLVRRNEREYEIDGDTPLSDLQELFRLPDEEFAFESETVRNRRRMDHRDVRRFPGGRESIPLPGRGGHRSGCGRTAGGEDPGDLRPAGEREEKRKKAGDAPGEKKNGREERRKTGGDSGEKKNGREKRRKAGGSSGRITRKEGAGRFIRSGPAPSDQKAPPDNRRSRVYCFTVKWPWIEWIPLPGGIRPPTELCVFDLFAGNRPDGFSCSGRCRPAPRG